MEIDCTEEFKLEELEYNDIIRDFKLKDYLKENIKFFFLYVKDTERGKVLKNKF